MCKFNNLCILFYSSGYHRNSKLIENVTLKEQGFINITITNSYKHLAIRAKVLSGVKTKFIISDIKIYYYFCEGKDIYNAKLSVVHSSTTSISKQVQCLDNAVSSDGNSTNITVMCTPTGEWVTGNQYCVCDKGFYLLDNKQCSRK